MEGREEIRIEGRDGGGMGEGEEEEEKKEKNKKRENRQCIFPDNLQGIHARYFFTLGESHSQIFLSELKLNVGPNYQRCFA